MVVEVGGVDAAFDELEEATVADLKDCTHL